MMLGKRKQTTARGKRYTEKVAKEKDHNSDQGIIQR